MADAIIKFELRAKPAKGVQFSLVPGPLLAQKQCGPERLKVAVTHPNIQALANTPQPDVVKHAGETLLKELTGEQDINTVMANQLANSSSCAWYMEFEYGTATAENLPWEALFESNAQFLALSANSPIGRIRSGYFPTAVNYLDRVPGDSSRGTLRILAVISAGDLPTSDLKREWDSLLKADLQAATSKHVNVEYCVVLSDDGSLSSPNTGFESHVRQTSGAQIVFPVKKQDITDAIYNFNPHIVHFFCHGTATHLQIADRLDYLAQRPGSIDLYAKDISDVLRTHDRSLWMVVLNCCHSATTSINTRSIASDLVHARIPMVVGMREPVDVKSASAFTGSFYSDVIRFIDRAWPTQFNNNVPVPVAIDWSAAFPSARDAIKETVRHTDKSSVAAGKRKEWTLPAHYRVKSDFEFGGAVQNPVAQAAHQVVREVQQACTAVPGIPQDLEIRMAEMAEETRQDMHREPF